MDRISMITALLARALAIKSIGGDSLNYIGVTTTALTDGATTNPITIDGDTVTATNGNVALYSGDAFVFNGTIWQASSAISQIFAEIGDLSDLDTEVKTDLVSAINEVNEEKQDDVELSLTPTAVVSDRDIIDGQGNTLSVLAEALTKTASGNPVVITDCAGGKARSLKTTINAIQDLHGYDHPWVGGAGKNLSPVENGNNLVLCAVESGVTYTFSLTTSDSVGFNLYKNNSEGELIINKTPITAGRTSVTFTADSNFNLYLNGFSLITGKNFAELTSLFMVEKGSTATSYAPYSNICPISGRTEARVDDVGKNLLDASAVTQGSFDDPSATANCVSDYIPVSGGTDYYMSGNSGYADGIYLRFYDANKTELDTSTRISKYVVAFGFTAPSAAVYTRIMWYKSGGLTPTNVVNALAQLEIGTTATAYVPYAHSSATIQLGTTVYGADINWDTGVMTVNDISITFDGGNDEEWSRYNQGSASAYAMQINNTTGNSDTNVRPKTNGASGLNSSDTYGNYDCFISTSHGANWIAGRRGISTVEDWKTWLASNPIQVCYKLVTPTTIQLTPTQLQMLKGYNRVTIDNGTITLDYIAKAISGNDEEIAPLVGDKATKSYSVNDFIERADGLYRVTAPIASGASFTANNTVKMSIGEALTYLYNK